MNWLKKLFVGHQHKGEIRKAVFPLGQSISTNASNGMANINIGYMPTHPSVPNTQINTYYEVDYANKTVTLYCYMCAECGETTKCNAFELQKFKEEHELLFNEMKGMN